MLTSQLKARYRAEVPRDVTKAIAELIIERYGIAADEAEIRWLAPEAADAMAINRRADIETGLTRLRGLFPGIVAVEAIANIPRTSRHREVYCSGWAITQSKIEHPHGPIRQADFRDILAEPIKAQLTMDDFIDPRSVVDDPSGRPWACITHMPADDHPEVPGILQVAFPGRNGRWEDYIDLYYEIAELRAYATSEYVLQLRADFRKRAMGL